MTMAVVVQPFQMRAPRLSCMSAPSKGHGGSGPPPSSPMEYLVGSRPGSGCSSALCCPIANPASQQRGSLPRSQGLPSVTTDVNRITPLPRMLDQSKAGRGGEIKATSKPEPDQATSKPEQPETINEERCKKTPPTKMSHLQRMQQTPKPTQA